MSENLLSLEPMKNPVLVSMDAADLGDSQQVASGNKERVNVDSIPLLCAKGAHGEDAWLYRLARSHCDAIPSFTLWRNCP